MMFQDLDCWDYFVPNSQMGNGTPL